MQDLFPIAIFLFVLFLLLGTGVWVGLALLGVAFVGMELFTVAAGGRRDDDDHLAAGVVVVADRPAALHLDGRDPVPHAAVGGHVQGAGAVDGEAAGRAAAYQHRRLHGLRRGLRLFGGHADDGRQDVDSRA